MLRLDSEVRLKVTTHHSGTEELVGEVAELPCRATGWRYTVFYTTGVGHMHMGLFHRTELTPVGLPAVQPRVAFL